MNNSKIAFDNVSEDVDTSREAILQRQQGELAQIVEAINGIEASSDWKKLKRLVLDGVLASLERQLATESAKEEIDAPAMYRLQGQLAWARKYADLKKLADFFKVQIEGLKNQIKHEQQNPTDGAV